MQKVKITISGEIQFTFDENSKEFKEALEGYRECIERRGAKESMLKHTAFYINQFGHNGIIEGVGYVGYNGSKPKEEPYSGIMVSAGYNEFDYDID